MASGTALEQTSGEVGESKVAPALGRGSTASELKNALDDICNAGSMAARGEWPDLEHLCDALERAARGLDEFHQALAVQCARASSRLSRYAALIGQHVERCGVRQRRELAKLRNEARTAAEPRELAREAWSAALVLRVEVAQLSEAASLLARCA